MDRIVRWIVAVAGGITLLFGIWAFAAPRSFFDQLATFEPYNAHFLHDIGVFQIGLGATLLLALVWRDAVRVALSGFAVAAGLHVVSHVMDADLGGKATDIPSLLVLFAAAAYALLRRSRSAERQPESTGVR